MRLAGLLVYTSLLLSGSLYAKNNEVMVGAATSLQDVLPTIATEFTKKHKKTKIQSTFAATNLIVRQVEAGSPIDVVLSADRNNIDQLRKSGLLNLNLIQNFVRNQMIVVTSSDFKVDLNGPKDSLKSEVKSIAVADAQVPIGFYTRQYLEKQKLLKDLEKKFVKAESARNAVMMVQKKAVQVAFVYFTDWKAIASELKIAWKVPENETDPIIYSAAATKKCRNREQCAAFINFLRTPESQAIFEKAGFLRIR